MSNQYNSNQMYPCNQPNLADQPIQTNVIQNSFYTNSTKSDQRNCFYGTNSANSMQISNNSRPNQPFENQSKSLSLYLALFGLADSFQKSNQIRLCIHCLESILLIKPIDMSVQLHFQLHIKTRLSLSRLYLKYVMKSNQMVNLNLEKAVTKIIIFFLFN